MIFIIKWWRDIKCKTRLLIVITILLSLIITTLIFLSLDIIRQDISIINHRFYKDMGELFNSQILDKVNLSNNYQLFSLLEKFYLSTSNIRYIFLFNIDGNLVFSLPMYYSVNHNLQSLHDIFIHKNVNNIMFNIPLFSNDPSFLNKITDIIIPLSISERYIGSIKLGINANLNYLFSSNFIYKIGFLIFIWVIFFSFFIFYSLSVINFFKDLLYGIQNISLSNFNQRIEFYLNNPFSDLITIFNKIAEKLAYYEKTNIDQIIVEKNKLESIVSIIADGAILVDIDLRFLFVNHTARQVFNWTNCDIVGNFIGFYLPAHITQTLLPIFSNLIKVNFIGTNNSFKEEFCIHLDYNKNEIFRFIITPILDINKTKLTSIAIIMQDIGKEIELNDAKHQFISNVSHELRTPLCNIGSFLETLLDYHNSLTLSQKKYFLNIANNETKRLARLVNDILDLSRLEFKMDYKLIHIHLIQLLSSVVKTFQLIAKKNHINLILDIDSNISYVLANEGLLFQVISNLLSNALKFTHTDGQVILRAYLLSSVSILVNKNNIHDTLIDLVRIEIIDEGIGIDLIDQKSIFDRFVRIEDDIHILKGTGLGLSIVKNILSKHNTNIMIQSHLCVGTSLYFDLLHINSKIDS
uniref:Uncharacterized sensor-like histidine kinase ycf26 n=1 Tax=Pleonosporium borreri TaxID=2575635 RepID=A0A4D6WWH8_9FLOR|nr:Drug sensory protein A [Pleonosporium borreri]